MTTIADACEYRPMRVLAYCVMPNHFHLMLWPLHDLDLSRWMQWLLSAQVRRYHRDHGGSGHVWEGRFRCFPVEPDDHLLSVMRDVEGNPVRAKLVKRAENCAVQPRIWARSNPVVQASPGSHQTQPQLARRRLTHRFRPLSSSGFAEREPGDAARDRSLGREDGGVAGPGVELTSQRAAANSSEDLDVPAG